MATKFPKRICVLRQDEEDGGYLLAYKDIDEIREDESGSDVAIYELKEIKKLSVAKVLR